MTIRGSIRATLGVLALMSVLAISDMAQASHANPPGPPGRPRYYYTLTPSGQDIRAFLAWRTATQPVADDLLSVISLTGQLDQISEKVLTGTLGRPQAQAASQEILKSAADKLNKAVQKLNCCVHLPKTSDKGYEAAATAYITQLKLVKTRADELLRGSASLYSKAVTGAKVLPALHSQQLARLHVILELNGAGAATAKAKPTGRDPDDFLEQCDAAANDGLYALVEYMQRRLRAPGSSEDTSSLRQRVQQDIQTIKQAGQSGVQAVSTLRVAPVPPGPDAAKSKLEKMLAEAHAAQVESFKQSFAVEQEIGTILAALAVPVLSGKPLDVSWTEVAGPLAQVQPALARRDALDAERFRIASELWAQILSAIGGS
jgi:hypothetical protein